MAGRSKRPDDASRRISVERWRVKRRMRQALIASTWLALLAVVIWRIGSLDVLERGRVVGKLIAVDASMRAEVVDDVGESRLMPLAGLRPFDGSVDAGLWNTQVSRLVDGRPVTITTGENRRSGDGVLIYPSIETTLNEWLVEQGYARADTGSGHPILPWLVRLERGARAEKRGLWAPAVAAANPLTRTDQ